MDDLVCAKKYPNKLEAELARNGLEAQGIYAAVVCGEGGAGAEYRLMVTADDLEKASAALEDAGVPEEAIQPQQREDVERQVRDGRDAQREFREMEIERLRAKAAGERSNALVGAVSFFLGVLSLLLVSNKALALRLGAGCLLFSVIQYFVWRDAAAARRELGRLKS